MHKKNRMQSARFAYQGSLNNEKHALHRLGRVFYGGL